ncbi:MAG: ArnT family glycosyltransferase [Anaerolineae bacterium]
MAKEGERGLAWGLSPRLGGWKFAFLLFWLALLPRVLNLGFFLTPDEPAWISRSSAFLRAILTGHWLDTDHTLWTAVVTPGGVPAKWLGAGSLLARYVAGNLGLSPLPAGAGSDLESYLAWLEERPQNLLDALVYVRWPVALTTSLAVVLFYFLFKRLFGGKAAGRFVPLTAGLGAIMLAFDPFYLAHSRVLHTDALAASFMTLAALCFLLYLEEGTVKWAAISGVAAGLAISTKMGALFLFPLVGLWTILSSAWRFGSARHQSAFLPRIYALALWGMVAVATFCFIWPAVWVEPLGTLQRGFARSSYLAEAGQRQFLMGQVADDPGPAFYPFVLLFRATPLALLGALAGLAMRPSCRFLNLREGAKPKFWLWSYIILFMIFITLSPKKNDRYLLPAFPAIDFLGTMGLLELWGWLRTRCLALRKVPGTLGTLSLVVLAAAFALPHHPYYLTYFNPAFGGFKAAEKTLLVGWGEGMEQTAAYLNGQKSGKVLAWYANLGFSAFYRGECRELSPMRQPAGDLWLWPEADYVVFYINQVQRKLPDEKIVAFFRARKPEYTARIKGMDYAWVYKVPEGVPLELWPFQHPLRKDFGEAVRPAHRGAVSLLGYDWGEPVRREERWHLPITLYWQSAAPLAGNYRLYLKLINSVYHVWGEQEGYPLWDGFMTRNWEPGKVIRDEREIEIFPGTPPGAYQLALAWLEPYSGHALSPSDGNDTLPIPVALLSLPLPPEALDIENHLRADWDEKVRLLGYNLESGLRPRDNIHLTLFWQCLAEIEENYTVFIHLVDEGGRLIAQKDNEPVDGFYPTSFWQKGEIVRDQYDFQIPPEAPPGEYRLEAGLYSAKTGERLPVLDGDKITLAEIAVRGD